MSTKPLNIHKVRAYPLSWRQSMTRISDILVNPDNPAPACPPEVLAKIQTCATRMVSARRRKAAIILMFGAHLVKNGAASLLTSLMYNGWLTHLAANGASAIHDWEFAFHGASTENVEQNVAKGCFGTWQETGKYIHLALLVGALDHLGFGASLGKFIQEDGVNIPSKDDLEEMLIRTPAHSTTPARAELLQTLLENRLAPGHRSVRHPWKRNSILGQAYQQKIPVTIHPGIGYDIIATHPMFNGAVIGRAGGLDFKLFAGAVEQLDGGVVLSVGSAIMAPQVFEKSISCVNNIRLQKERDIVRNHSIFVVDIQDGGRWDWSLGEPPKDNPAYYQRYCKSFSRMGGKMEYVHCDNVVFLHNLLQELNRLESTDD